MENRKFRSGDKVRHKSGGRVTVVQDYSEETNMFACEWYDDGRFVREQFLESALELYQPPTNDVVPVDDPLAVF